MIQKLISKIDTLTQHINGLEEANTDNDYANYLMIQSLKAERDQLIDQVKTSKILWNKEVIEAHVKGKMAAFGQMPLNIMNGTLISVYNAFINASSRINYGIEKKRKPKEIDELIRYNLATLTGGSTKFYFTANAETNIFNENLADITFNNIFETLNAESIEQLMETYNNIGIKSLKNFHDLFSILLNNDLSIDFSWINKDGKENVWISDKDKLKVWKSRIEQIRSQKLPSVKIKGVVTLLSLYNRIEILSDDKLIIKAMYPVSLLDEIQNYT